MGRSGDAALAGIIDEKFRFPNRFSIADFLCNLDSSPLSLSRGTAIAGPGRIHHQDAGASDDVWAFERLRAFVRASVDARGRDLAAARRMREAPCSIPPA